MGKKQGWKRKFKLDNTKILRNARKQVKREADKKGTWYMRVDASKLADAVRMDHNAGIYE